MSTATRPQRQRKMAFIRAEKAEQGCRDCGERDYVVLEFHHVGDKHPRLKRNSNGVGKNFHQLSWKDLHEEIKKCVVLCANCHRRETHRERLASQAPGASGASL